MGVLNVVLRFSVHIKIIGYQSPLPVTGGIPQRMFRREIADDSFFRVGIRIKKVLDDLPVRCGDVRHIGVKPCGENKGIKFRDGKFVHDSP